MMTYLVIGLCLILLLAVIIIAAKPIGMGIEARRNIKDSLENSEDDEFIKMKLHKVSITF